MLSWDPRLCSSSQRSISQQIYHIHLLEDLDYLQRGLGLHTVLQLQYVLSEAKGKSGHQAKRL